MFSYGRGGIYNPGSSYGYQPMPGPWGNARSYMDTYPGGADIELNPEAYYTHSLGRLGYGGVDPRSNAARGMYGRFFDAYKAARLQNNALTWRSFLDDSDIRGAINALSPQERGENPSNTVPWDIRWLQR